MSSIVKRIVTVVVVLAVVGGIAFGVFFRLQDTQEGGPRRGGASAAPVEVAIVETGSIAFRRTFSGTLEPTAQFVVAPKISGRVKELRVDMADTVRRGDVVARLDDEEYVQAVKVAEAELRVATANAVEAKNALEIAERELGRVQTLFDRGVSSESQLDTARAEELAASSRVEVAKAEVTRAESALEAANIRLGYTQVTAGWSDGDDQRVVGRRYISAGDTLSANAPILSIIELDPIMGVMFITEKDYASLERGQKVTLETDAYPGATFEASVSRISPQFDEGSRQARVELTVANKDRRLKPGMFIRATVVLDQADDAVIVPAQAVTRRDDRDGVFMVDEGDMVARWTPMTLGIRDGDRIEVRDAELAGRVITLGQQMVDDGTPIVIPGDPASPAPAGETAAAAPKQDPPANGVSGG